MVNPIPSILVPLFKIKLPYANVGDSPKVTWLAERGSQQLRWELQPLELESCARSLSLGLNTLSRWEQLILSPS